LRGVEPAVSGAQSRMLAALKPADRKTLLKLMARLVDLNNETSRAPVRPADAGRRST